MNTVFKEGTPKFSVEKNVKKGPKNVGVCDWYKNKPKVAKNMSQK